MYSFNIKDNFASFYDIVIMQKIFVQSFDGEQFDIRIGSSSSSESLGSIFCSCSEELNEKIEILIDAYNNRT
jgi:hypothetical protein